MIELRVSGASEYSHSNYCLNLVIKELQSKCSIKMDKHSSEGQIIIGWIKGTGVKVDLIALNVFWKAKLVLVGTSPVLLFSIHENIFT